LKEEVWRHLDSILEKAKDMQPEDTGGSMTNHFSKDLEKLLKSIPEIGPEERERFIRSEITGNRNLEESINAFFENTHQDCFSSKSLFAPLIDAALAFFAARKDLAEQIGPYKILKKLGEGGMGRVYLAHQDQPFQRFVALKLMREDLSPNAREQFRFESQVLSRLDHKSIARVFDAGTENINDAEVSFFAMEYFPGIPITEFGRHHRLTLEERINLFLDACDGVAHANQRGLIHRDIKPSNILVRYVDDIPRVKIIDFGIAALLPERGVLDPKMKQDISEPAGTLLYMSPEQLSSGAGLSPDTRTDVYGLGLVLYEMVTGHHPFDRSGFESLPPNQRREYLIQEPIPDPSTYCAEKQNRKLRRILLGDLGRIITTSTAKEMKLRYNSAATLADDLRAYLDYRPISAGSEKFSYLFGKFLRRRRWIVVASFFGLVAILGALIFSIRAWRDAVNAEGVARQAQFEAEKTATKYKVMHDFLRNMLRSSNPYEDGRDIRVVDLLDSAGRRLPIDFQDQPGIMADLHVDLAETNLGLGRYDLSLYHFDEAFRLRKNHFGMNDADTLQVMGRKAYALLSQKETDAAEKLYRDTLSLQAQHFGEEHPNLYPVRLGLGNTFARMRRFEEASDVLGALEEEQREALGSDHLDTLLTMLAVGNLWSRQNRQAEAEGRYLEVLDGLKKHVGPYHPYTLSTLRSFATSLSLQGRWKEEESARRELLGYSEKVLGNENPQAAIEKHLLARCLYHLGDYVEAEALASEALEIAEDFLALDHEDTLSMLNDLALIKGELGKNDEKAVCLETYLDRCLNRFGSRHRLTIRGVINLADHYRTIGQFERAAQMLKDVIQTLEETSGSRFLLVFAIFNYAETLQALDRLSKAAETYQNGLAQMGEVFDENDPYRQHFHNQYAGCLIEMRRYGEAESILKSFAAKPVDHPYALNTIEKLVDLYTAWDKRAELEKWRRKLEKVNARANDQQPKSTKPAQ
jgi:serine/threonine protein kinase